MSQNEYTILHTFIYVITFLGNLFLHPLKMKGPENIVNILVALLKNSIKIIMF